MSVKKDKRRTTQLENFERGEVPPRGNQEEAKTLTVTQWSTEGCEKRKKKGTFKARCGMWHTLEDMLFKMNQGRCDPVFDLVRVYQVMRKTDQKLFFKKKQKIT